MSPSYPFSAVVGQEPLKLALLLCAIDPALGGVLVRGPRGVAKTTLARALSAFVDGPFVELPLGATEERLTGSIELESALREGRVVLAQGLLARAHRGVLYVDEVNLLPDGLVDLLLDAAASGVNVVERDGVSQRDAARFVLVGTMNPEEGELRPQLTDRFGLAVNAAAEISPRERVRIVALRLEHDHDPAAFAARYAAEERVLAERCARARTQLAMIPLDPDALEQVSERCYEAGVEGVRADLAMLRAARAHAAWHGRAAITTADIDAVAELALQHRRVSSPHSGGSPSGGTPPGTSSGSPSGGTPPGSASSGRSRSARPGEAGAVRASSGSSAARADGEPAPAAAVSGGEPAATGSGSSEPRSDSDWGRRDALAVPILSAGGPLVESMTRAGLTLLNTRAARPVARAAHGTRKRPSVRVDWFRTLLARRTGATAPRFRAERTQPLWIVAVDCSASMLRKGALSRAKGLVLALGLRARARRAAVHLITFGGHAAHVHRAITRSAQLDRAVVPLGAGGGTPLRNALVAARRLAHTRRDAREQRLFLLSDGRSRARLHDLAQLGRELNALVIDCECTRPRLGGARAIAEQLHAGYVHID
jgi:magnesium chelatase subunit D